MSPDHAAARCLNCGEPLSGPFCSSCGQRAVPAYPTLRELVGDAWQELSGYDGRVARTFRHLLWRPGALTVEVLEGHRARYVSPVRVYLVASVLYFLVAAVSPNAIEAPRPKATSRGDFNIDLSDPEKAVAQLTPEKRAEILAGIERAPWWMRPVLRSAVLDPLAFKQRVVVNLPRVLFALVPVCAVILALFYRRRPFSQHLILALHVHAVIFLAAAFREAADFTYSPVVVGIAGLLVLIFTVAYVLLALRTVYRERWRSIVLLTLGVTVVYGIACLAGIVVTLGWRRSASRFRRPTARGFGYNPRVPKLLLTPLVWAVTVVAVAAADRPNIIFIMSDDHAAHAISAYGSKVNQTPNIDRLAREGMVLRNVFVTNSICTPSRAAILTGQYSHLNGVPVFNRFDSSRTTVAKLLQASGYYTGMIGKWHLGSDPAGFDRWEILPGQGAYMNPLLYTSTGEKTYTGRYVTDVITDLAIDFIKERPRNRPFFMMVHHKAPHRPWEPDAAHRAQFANQWIPEPETLWDSYATRTDALHENLQRVAGDTTRRDLKLEPPADLKGPELTSWLSTKPQSVTITLDGKETTLTGEALARWKYQRYMRDYLATVQSVDDNVGRLLGFLDTAGLARNTIVIYTSDQGFFLGDHGLFDKRFMYEESLRMPFLVRWPAGIKAGSRSDAMALNVDFAPTFLEAAGVKIPGEMQGRSLLPILRGKTPADWRSSMYYRYYHDPGDHNTRAHYGVRTATHKLIYFWKKDQWELFDLVRDPNELHNLYGQPGQEELTRTLKAELQRLKQAVRDEDQFAQEQPPGGVDGPPGKLRGK